MSLTQVTTRGIAKGVEVVLSSGLTGDPSLAWSGDEDTGLYSSAAGYTDFTSNGTTVLSIGPDGLNFPSGATTPIKFNGTNVVTFDAAGLTIANGKQLILPQGSASTPSIGFTGDTNTGIFSSGDGEIDFVSNGVVKLSIDSTGLVLPTGISGSSINVTNSQRVLYVSINDTLATDSITNTGRSLNKPFKTIERALLEAAVQSWRSGSGDEQGEDGADLFEFFTIMIFPGEYEIDNRPGDGSNSNILTQAAYTDTTLSENLYRFNATNGGVIVPRGTSLVGLDLRKTIIRPKYVPSPVDASAVGTGIFRLTGGCYMWQLTIKDNNKDAQYVYKSASSTYTNTGSDVFPCSHHKVTVFEYASYPDLTSYYSKVDQYSPLDDVALQSQRHGDAQTLLLANKRFIAEVAVGRMLTNFPSFSVPGGRSNCEDDIEDVIEALAYNVAYGGNNKVVAAAGLYVSGGSIQHVGGEETQSVYAFNQAKLIANEVINNVLVTVTSGDTAITQVRDLTITADPVTGSNTSAASCANVTSQITTLFTIVTDTISNPSSFASQTSTAPPAAGTAEDYIQRIEENRIVGSVATAILSDTVQSASPYVFNCSMRSVFGMNGLHADGSRATGFKSMVLAQYTGIALQKDDRAFVGSNLSSGIAQTNAEGNNYHIDPTSEYRDDWRHFHIKASNDGFLQVVSVFAVGNADHFLAESGGDMSITNSNSNFGNTALKAVSHRPAAFTQDSGGYIVGVVPPRGIDSTKDNLIGISEVDVGHTVTAYSAAKTANQEASFKKVYIKINNESLIKESDIPEFYTKNSSGTITKAELLVDGLNYSLGKREHSDSLPEAIYCNLSKHPADPTNELFGARIRLRDLTNSLDPANTYTKVSPGSGTYTTKNDVRSYYGWEYVSTNADGDDLGRVCILVDDSRAGGSATISGIPTGFSIAANGTNTYPDKADGDYTVTANVTTPATPTTQSDPIDVIVTIVSNVITAVAPASNGGSAGTPGSLSGSGFAVGNQLTLPDGVATGLGTRVGSAELVIQVATIGSLTNQSFTSENIKADGYLTSSSIGPRYKPINQSVTLENQTADRLSLLRRLTQRVDSNNSGNTTILDDFNLGSSTTTTAQIKRIQDNRQASGSGELLWRFIYKLPNTGTVKRKPPESRFTIQLRDTGATYPFTYNGTTTGSKTFYIYSVEPIIEYQFGTGGRDGYYMLTVLDGNVITKTNGTSFTNTINYGVQTTSGNGYSVADTVVTGWGVSQNINYLYPEIDLDNPKWNPKPSTTRYNPAVKNTIALDTDLVTDGYDRITQYSITAESSKNFLNGVLAGGSIAGSLTNELNLNTFFGLTTLTDAKMEAPYSVSGNNTYGVDKGAVTEFTNDIPVFSDRVILLGTNVTTNATAGTPVNLHRPSILRASGHTWEYVGFGPGNYSTGLPRFQTETLNAQEQVNAQGLESGGGFIASSGTNSQGDFFIGNQVIDTKGNQSNTLNFPRIKTSADNKLIDFGDPASLASNSASSTFNPSSFSASLTQSLANLQAAQQNSFKTANLEAQTATIGTLKVDTKLEIATNVFQTVGNFPSASQGTFGFAKRAVDNWFNLDTTSNAYENEANSFISPKDLADWANKNAFITTNPINWPLLSTDLPAAGSYNAVSNAGSVTDLATLAKTSNFTFQPYDPVDARWYDSATGVTNAAVGAITNLTDYTGRSGQFFLIYDSQVKLGGIHPSGTWRPVENTFKSIDPVSGNPVAYLTSQYFLVTYYVTNGKVLYAVNAVSLS
tara:strand:- start:3415 stop:8697 length:5283 start_codon:yes stop_codon:yes gene_type:complete